MEYARKRSQLVSSLSKMEIREEILNAINKVKYQGIFSHRRFTLIVHMWTLRCPLPAVMAGLVGNKEVVSSIERIKPLFQFALKNLKREL
ncbi:hypothetical protein [Methanolobus sp.]|uniref:hypothetical protein n=1 Tax=Methanolobus sp. TaxID=1874737 RepID=UPI0025DA1D4F|nr:hypothetical protein [Methanolobus sp.]